MPKVGIVISNYNGWQDTVQCLQSLEKQTFRDFEIILLDDASPTTRWQRLRRAPAGRTRCFCRSGENLGFAAVNNLGMRRALADGCEWALLLNNDTVAAPDFVETLLRETPAGRGELPQDAVPGPAGRDLVRGRRHWTGPPARCSTWAATPKDGPAFARARAGELHHLLLRAAAAAGHRAGGVPGRNAVHVLRGRGLLHAPGGRRAYRCGSCPTPGSGTRRAAAPAGCCRCTTSPATRCI